MPPPLFHAFGASMVDLSRVTAGLKGTAQLLVGPEHTAPFVGSGRIPVLATPVMINVIEAAALNAIEHLLPSEHQSLGTHLDVSHVAATPVGLRVTATAEVLAVDARNVRFRVEARDDFEVIGGGTHRRVVVSVPRFDARIQRKVPAGTRPQD
jgi:predicted thioesterase